MIIKRKCGCKFVVETSGGLSTVTFKRYLKRCKKHTDDKNALRLFMENLKKDYGR